MAKSYTHYISEHFDLKITLFLNRLIPSIQLATLTLYPWFLNCLILVHYIFEKLGYNCKIWKQVSKQKKTTWKYFKFVKALANWTFTVVLCVCVCLWVGVCVCVCVCVYMLRTNNFSKASSNGYKICTVKTLLTKKLQKNHTSIMAKIGHRRNTFNTFRLLIK